MFVAAVRTSLHHYEQVGAIWGTEFFHLISEDAMNLALSDMVMVSATLLCVPFAKVGCNFSTSLVEHLADSYRVCAVTPTWMAPLLLDGRDTSTHISNFVFGLGYKLDVSSSVALVRF